MPPPKRRPPRGGKADSKQRSDPPKRCRTKEPETTDETATNEEWIHRLAHSTPDMIGQWGNALPTRCQALFSADAPLSCIRIEAYHKVWLYWKSCCRENEKGDDSLAVLFGNRIFHPFMPKQYQAYYMRWKKLKSLEVDSKKKSSETERPFEIRVVDWVLEEHQPKRASMDTDDATDEQQSARIDTLHASLCLLRDLVNYHDGSDTAACSSNLMVDFLESVHWHLQVSNKKNKPASLLFPDIVRDIVSATARPLTVYRQRSRIFQQLCLTYEVPDVIYAGGGALQDPSFVRDSTTNLTDDQLCTLLETVGWYSSSDHTNWSRQWAVALLLDYLVPPETGPTLTPLYPTERDMRQALQGSRHPQYPKLGLGNFRDMQDYWDRHYRLVHAAAAYDCGTDVVAALRNQRSATWIDDVSVEIIKVIYPHLSTTSSAESVDDKDRASRTPTQVVAKLTLNQPHQNKYLMNNPITMHETLLLVAADRRAYKPDDPLASVTAVRGGHVVHVDEPNADDADEQLASQKKLPCFTIHLDPLQYAADRAAGVSYEDQLRAVVRRDPKVNQFRSVLQSLRDVAASTATTDSKHAWWNKLLLGHSTNTATSTTNSFLDLADTFVDDDHVRVSFPDHKVTVEKHDIPKDAPRKYRIRILDDKKVTAIAYTPKDSRRCQLVRFTPRQVRAIYRGLTPGLSVVVGPPGTGKTDVAVQMIASLYHSFPNQRTVVVAHSNAALNDIFTKVMERGDIPERYLLRLGAGERDLVVPKEQQEHDFTQAGRVSYSWERRQTLLERVQTLSESLGLGGRAERGADGTPSYTCETAAYFMKLQVLKRIRVFEENRKTMRDEDKVNVRDIFPFVKFFDLAEDAILTNGAAQSHLDSVKDIFSELAEYRPLELLRTQRQRGDYLIMKQARVVAMTCTHAAISREHLLKVSFQYDNLVIEEAGQMLEIETVVPMLLQKDKVGVSTTRLKRITVLGDHNQLPPVIQHIDLARFASFDQSLLARLVRNNVPYTLLDQQGRSRPELANLYRYRYDSLQDMPHVAKKSSANAGLVHVAQVIDVQDFEGHGEQCPRPHFYQNRGEAEYAVALFQYLVLIGHKPHRISLLTTYNGQKDLIKTILSQRCGPDTPLAAVRPGAVATVDQYQGQQNDLVILSLVRTERVGHLQDVRRLVVAVSRARQGLYILCRKSLFTIGAPTLRRTFDQLQQSDKLQLVMTENPPCERKVGDAVPPDEQFEIEDVGHLGAVVHEMQLSLTES